MKTMKAIVLTMAIAICGTWVAVSASGNSMATACDTTKCQIRLCHGGDAKACTGHMGIKCEKAGSAECKDKHAKGTCTGHSPEKCIK
jgi:hypothetical protein